MKLSSKVAWSLTPLLAALCIAAEQQQNLPSQPSPPEERPRPRAGGPDRSPEQAVERLMAMDANKDGVLTKDEVDDPRLNRVLERADADKDGKVTKEELTALLAKEGAR